MKTRQELLDTLARSEKPIASLMVIGIFLADIRDLLLAAEERTQRFENEVERIKRERERELDETLNANLS